MLLEVTLIQLVLFIKTEDIPLAQLLVMLLEVNHMLTKPHKLSTLLSILEKKLLKEKAELNTFHSKRKSLNIEIKFELKESQKPEKSLNIENKKESKPFQEKLLKLIIMLFNI
jgi:hypothetical protein